MPITTRAALAFAAIVVGPLTGPAALADTASSQGTAMATAQERTTHSAATVYRASTGAVARDPLNCTTTRFGALCNKTKGEGTFVRKVRGILITKERWVCNMQFLAWGTLPNGRQWSARGMSKCGPIEVFKDFYPNMRFKKNSKLCVAVRDASVPRSHFEPYHACNKIK